MGLIMDAYIVDVLMRDLIEHEKHPSAFVVYLFVWRQTIARDQKEVSVSYQGLSEATGLSKSAVQNAVKLLGRRKLVAVKREYATATPSYRPLRPWIRRKHA